MDQPFYLLDGQKYPRLTRILAVLREPQIEKWKERVGLEAAKRELKAAEKTGRELHKMVEQTLLTGKQPKLPSKASKELESVWHAWQDWYRLRPQGWHDGIKSVEAPYISSIFGFGCTPDLVMTDEVVDWKTSYAIQPKHWVQVNAEIPLIFKIGSIKRRIVRLDKKLGMFEEKVLPFSEGTFQTFTDLLKVYREWYWAADQEEPVEEAENG